MNPKSVPPPYHLIYAILKLERAVTEQIENTLKMFLIFFNYPFLAYSYLLDFLTNLD